MPTPCPICHQCFQVTVKQHMESVGELAKATELWEEEHVTFWKGKSMRTYGSRERSWTSNLGRLEPNRNVAALPWSLFTINSWAPAQCFIWEQPPAFLWPCSVSLLHWHIYTQPGPGQLWIRGHISREEKGMQRWILWNIFHFSLTWLCILLRPIGHSLSTWTLCSMQSRLYF